MDLNKKLKELKPQQLNCNVFDVYSYNGLTMQDLLCQFFTTINECVKSTNEVIDLTDWLVNIGLEEEVVKKLMVLIEDGTVEKLINVNLFNTLNDKINGLSSQLEQKANEDEVRKKSILITEYDISDKLKQQINGNAPIMQTIANKSVSKEKTTFFKIGKNLFNKESAIEGYFVSQVTGTLDVNNEYFASDFIEIEQEENYIINGNYSTRYALYDIDYNFINGGVSNNFTTTNNSVYVRFSCNLDKNKIQLEKGNISTYHEDYKNFLPIKDVERHTHDLTDLNGLIAEDNTIFFEKSANLVNKNDCVNGFVSGVDGLLYDHDTYMCTDFIKIEQDNYTYLGGLDVNHAACYDINKKYVCGLSNFKTSDKTFKITDNNVKFVRLLVINKSSLDTIFLHKGVDEISYSPYGYYLKDEYIKKEDNQKSIIINLPPKMYALEGEEFNIYFDNILEGRYTDYIIDVNCSQGMQLERCYRLTPTQKGEIDITFNIYDKDMNNLGYKKSKLIISSKNQGNGKTKKLIILGDSTTNNGTCVSKLNENFASDVMNIVTIGTRGYGINKHEGRSGWTFKQYLDTYEDKGAPGVFNAFYNQEIGTFDFDYYIKNNGFEDPDYVFINLGINDTFSFYDDLTLNNEINILFNRCDYIVNSIKSYNENIKIGIALTIPPNYSQDAFGKAYSCGQTRDRYKRNNILWVNAQINRYKDRENEGIYLIPIHCNLDTKYNFGFEEIQVNKRNTMTYLSPIANGGVHPVESGYWQCADTYWYFLKAQEN